MNQPESLRTGRAAIDFGQAVLAIDLVLQLVTAAIDLPGEELAVLRSERHRREEPAVLAGVEARRAVAGLDRALRCGIEALERGHERARLIELELEVTVGEARDHRLHALGGDAGVRQVTGKRALHFPVHAFLRVSRGRERERSHRHAGRHESSTRSPDHLAASLVWLVALPRGYASSSSSPLASFRSAVSKPSVNHP